MQIKKTQQLLTDLIHLFQGGKWFTHNNFGLMVEACIIQCQ